MKELLKNEKTTMTIITCLVFAISVITITNNSMWNDEICRVFDPITGNLINTLKTGLKFAQPGYLLFMYLWERIIFSSQVEFLIRCINLFFVPIALYYSYKIAKVKKWNLWSILLFFIHPMFTYYMNEATPYIMVYSLSLAYTYYVFFSKDFNSTSNIVKINLVYFLGVFIHFIFGFIIVIYITKCLLENYKNKENLLKHFKVLCVFCLIYVPLLILYVLNLVHVTTGFSIKNIAYVLYGFLGMAGIGLSRNDLRALNFSKITSLQIICLIIMAITCLLLLYFILKKIKVVFKKEANYLICILAFFVVIFGISFAINFGVWERHSFSAFPLFMIILIDILYIIKENSKISSIFIALYIFMLLFSSLNIRFNYYYQCDDYKGVYNYVKENKIDHVKIIANYTSDIYDIHNILKNNLFNVKDLSDDEIIDLFENNDNNTKLILFEKNSSKKLYNYFDDNKNYIVNSNFNSFKIIEGV